jgi:hypothetical protein
MPTLPRPGTFATRVALRARPAAARLPMAGRLALQSSVCAAAVVLAAAALARLLLPPAAKKVEDGAAGQARKPQRRMLWQRRAGGRAAAGRGPIGAPRNQRAMRRGLETFMQASMLV